MASTVVNGVKFRAGQLDWEDAWSGTDTALPDLTALASGGYGGVKFEATGLIGKIANYYIVITKHNEDFSVCDFTLVPRKAKITVKYHSRRK
jgi:hypothetical protein